MKTLTLLFSFFLLYPLSLGAQANSFLQKVSQAIAEGKNDYVVSLFRQAASAEIDQAEMYYWTRVNKSSVIAPRLAKELAVLYKEARNYDKAFLFCKEFLQYHPEDVSILVFCGEMQMMRGEEKEAVNLYEKVLSLDANNLQANIFLGNYYYLQAENDKRKIEEDYKKISNPTTMQNARYRNGLSDVFTNSYTKAKIYLQRVLQLFPSTEAVKTLEKIKKIEKDIK